MASAIAIKDNLKRMKQNHLLLFPEEITLNNRVFSGDLSGRIQQSLAPMQEAEASNKFVIDPQSLGIYWIVAEKDSGCRIKSHGVKTDVKAMFTP